MACLIVLCVLQLFVMLVFAGIVGGIYYQRPDTPRGMQDR